MCNGSWSSSSSLPWPAARAGLVSSALIGYLRASHYGIRARGGPSRSWQRSYQVNEGEDADPDHVEEVPEHRQTHEPPPIRSDQPVPGDLRHQCKQPDDAERHVQTVRGDEREERRQEGTALWAVALVDQVRELVQLDADEPGAQQTGECQPGERRALAFSLHPDHRETVGDR